MSLFNYALRNIEEVVPWGDSLHWFGLTDGVYFMKVGEQTLFESSEEALQLWKKEYPSIDLSQHFVDYQVVRLYEDMLDILPSILEPLPHNVFDLISSPEREKHWYSQLHNQYDRADESNNEWFDAYYEVTGWWGARHLSTMHLCNAPKIVFWRVDNQIYIRWDNTENIDDGVAVWTATTGQISMTVDEFLNELHLFHNRLMNDMKERVERISTNNPIPQVKIDIPRLIEEQKERERSLDLFLQQPAQATNWERIIDLHQFILKQF